jgi:DNA-binding NtrC family response regulator
MTKPRVLVVDDDDMVLRSTLRVLREFDCKGTSKPKEALSLILSEPFDAVVSDVSMPEMGGFDLFQAACKEKPSMSDKFVFVTGGTHDVRVMEWLRSVKSLAKPFRIPELIESVRSITGCSRLHEP